MPRFDDGTGYGGVLTNPVKGPGFDSPQMSAVLVIGALLALVMIRRGFRGVNVLGASARIG